MTSYIFTKFSMFIYGGISAYSINYYLQRNNFKSGFRCGINELSKGDSKPITDKEFQQHYNFYKKKHQDKNSWKNFINPL